MKRYKLNLVWEILLPHDWVVEFDKIDNHYVFYPKDSDLTIRITPFHAESNGLLAPKELMKTSYINSISSSAIPLNINQCTINNSSWVAYEDVQNHNKQKVYVINAGIFADGELLSINIYSTNKSECNDALKYIRGILKN